MTTQTCPLCGTEIREYGCQSAPMASIGKRFAIPSHVQRVFAVNGGLSVHHACADTWESRRKEEQ